MSILNKHSISARDTSACARSPPGAGCAPCLAESADPCSWALSEMYSNSFAGSLQIHFYTDLFNKSPWTKWKWQYCQPDISLLTDTAIQILTCLKLGQVDTMEVSITIQSSAPSSSSYTWQMDFRQLHSLEPSRQGLICHGPLYSLFFVPATLLPGMRFPVEIRNLILIQDAFSAANGVYTRSKNRLEIRYI